MIEELQNIERQAMGNSRVHRLDARTKIILAFAAIIAMVAYPYSPDVIVPGVLLFAFFTVIWAFSGLSAVTYLKRLILILPFGIFIIIFQIFFENSRYDTFTPILNLPLGIHVYAESVEFATILLIKFIVCRRKKTGDAFGVCSGNRAYDKVSLRICRDLRQGHNRL